MFLGYQDTLYINRKRLFFKYGEIYLIVDFIFGNALAVFQDCRIYARLLNNTVRVTAQSEESIQQLSGFSFQNCTVIFMMESFLNSVVNPAGWSEGSNSSSLKLLFYSEYGNRRRG